MSQPVCSLCCRELERQLTDQVPQFQYAWYHRDDHSALCQGAKVAYQEKLPLSEASGEVEQ